ncbi:ATP-binding protein [Mariniflexile sp. AS56]|uniref:ATP-binding protein n=1 Tax=Mariniflexile sp. AS56 TaxID=3063957 RepID=UPI0026F29A98|nr:ATP-binding protein [Mariniflexile sp. AS56]MDO7173839.1 ATP-binding protein [Mariniflexile sp. AS56]
MKKYPFKFLDSYKREDRGVFFGRDEEINALYEMVFQSSIILIYGASGTGKTSLINCGLAGKFQPHDWLALMIRRGSNINESLEKALNEAGGKVKDSAVGMDWFDNWTDESEKNTTRLSPIGKSINAVYEKSFKPIYLIFDQFEELFILGSISEQELFIKTVQDILQSQQPVKLIFSIREEYLGHLSGFERAVPQLLRKKLRIEPMNLEKVKQVIIGAAAYKDSNVSLQLGESDLVAEGIFDKIKGEEKSLTIQLPFLQVFLDKFYLKITGDESRTADAKFNMQSLNEMGEIGDVLIDFLEEQVSGISNKLKVKHPVLTPDMIWKILSPFSTLEGTKDPISKQDLYERLPNTDIALIDYVVGAFINSRILRYNESSDRFEIAHDALAKPIAEKRSVEETAQLEIKRLIKSQVAVKEQGREYFTEKQLLFIEPYLEKYSISEEEKEWISKSKSHVTKEKLKNIDQQYAELQKKRRINILSFTILGLLILIASTVSLGMLARKKGIIAEQEKVKSKIAEDRTKELLKLVLQGRGEQYKNQNDSLIVERLRIEQTYPIDSLIVPRASVSASNKGSNNRNFMLWIDVPSFRKYEIKEVNYKLCKGFVDRLRVSNEPSSSFSIGYLGYGYCPTVDIDVVLKTGDTIRKSFSFEDFLNKNPLH